MISRDGGDDDGDDEFRSRERRCRGCKIVSVPYLIALISPRHYKGGNEL